MVRKTAGVTLVELIIVLAIMSIVIVAGFQVHAFSQRTASRGLNEAQIQTQQRMAADFVLRELRYAGNVRLLPDMPAASSIDLNTRYIFIHSSGVPYIMESGVERAIPGVETSNTASMQFTPIDNQTVGFRIETENKGQTHVLESSVALLNETGLSETPSSGSVIAYGDAQYALFQSVEVGGGSEGTGDGDGGSTPIPLSDLLQQFSYSLSSANVQNPTITITPPADTNGAIYSVSADESQGILSKNGNIIRVARPNGGHRSRDITITVSRDGQVETRTLTVYVPAGSGNVTIS